MTSEDTFFLARSNHKVTFHFLKVSLSLYYIVLNSLKLRPLKKASPVEILGTDIVCCFLCSVCLIYIIICLYYQSQATWYNIYIYYMAVLSSSHLPEGCMAVVWLLLAKQSSETSKSECLKFETSVFESILWRKLHIVVGDSLSTKSSPWKGRPAVVILLLTTHQASEYEIPCSFFPSSFLWKNTQGS